MTTREAQRAGRTRRRVRYGASTLALMLAATAACAGAIALAERHRARIDITALREHTLSERTRAVLERLDAVCEVVVVADAGSVDPRARQLIVDLLDSFARASDRLAVTWIDPTTAQGLGAYESLLARLVESRAETVRAHAAGIADAVAHADALAADMLPLAERAARVRDALPGADQRRERLELLAAAARVRADELSTQTRRAEQAGSIRIGAVAVPAAADAQAALSPALRAIGADLGTMSDWLAQVARLDGRDDATDDLSALARAAATLRDRALVGADAIERLGPLDVHAVVRTLRQGNAALVISPERITAVHFASLFPPSEALDETGARVGVRFAGEELLATAIGAVTNRKRPIVVFVHGVDERLFDEHGAPATPAARQFLGGLVDRVRMRGADVVEWAAALDADEPALTRHNPDGSRPVVWVVTPAGDGSAEGAQRASRIGAALARLIERGERALVSLEPSTLPRIGEPDPMAAPLRALGVNADTGRPLMQRIASERATVVWPEFRTAEASREHPIGGAIDGLGLFLTWPIALTLSDERGVEAHAITTIGASEQVWGESQWIAFRAVARSQRPFVVDPPRRDPARDNVSGPWHAVVAAERFVPERSEPQRVVVVGSHGWFTDPVTTEAQTIDGRAVLTNPANAELFDASVAWLAGMDDLIAPSPRSRQIARIGALRPDALSALRWSLALGLPVCVLLLGATVRLLRG